MQLLNGEISREVSLRSVYFIVSTMPGAEKRGRAAMRGFRQTAWSGLQVFGLSKDPTTRKSTTAQKISRNCLNQIEDPFKNKSLIEQFINEYVRVSEHQ